MCFIIKLSDLSSNVLWCLPTVLPGYTMFLIYNRIASLTRGCACISVHAGATFTKRESKFKLVEDMLWLMFQTDSTWVIGLLFVFQIAESSCLFFFFPWYFEYDLSCSLAPWEKCFTEVFFPRSRFRMCNIKPCHVYVKYLNFFLTWSLLFILLGPWKQEDHNLWWEAEKDICWKRADWVSRDCRVD